MTEKTCIGCPELFEVGVRLIGTTLVTDWDCYQYGLAGQQIGEEPARLFLVTGCLREREALRGIDDEK